MRSFKEERLGETKVNTQGCLMTITEYNGARNILVKFEDGHTARSTYRYFNSGMIKNNFYPSICNIGYVGNTTTADNNGKIKRSYDVWQHMIKRCYDVTNTRYKRYGERGVMICDTWHSYESFEKWYNENYYEIEGERIELDKDILVKNNEVYSPNTCLFVPQKINTIFIKSNETRGVLPIGVSYARNKNTKKYISMCSIREKDKSILKHIGVFNTPEEAFYAYKETKEQYIKQVADQYKSKIPQKLYDAMYKYQVEITD